MTHRRTPPDQRLKRRYNLCHRLRLKGIAVDTDTHAINVATLEEYEDLPKTARRYIDTLRDEYHFVVQTYIPVVAGRAVEQGNPAPAVKFYRKRSP